MEIVVLGSGTAVPRAGQAPPALLVRSARSTVLVDSGAGTATRLAAAGCSLADLDAILYTHHHLDHVGDLPSILFALGNPEGPARTRPLPICAPPGFGRLLAALAAAHGDHVAPPCGVALREIAPRPAGELLAGPPDFVAGDLAVRAAAVAHAPGAVCLGFRLEADGAALAVSGDTEECEGADALAAGADCLVAECSLPDSAPLPGHLCPSAAGRLARRAGCGRLVLVHLYPSCDRREAAATAGLIAGCETLVAEDGQRIAVDPR